MYLYNMVIIYLDCKLNWYIHIIIFIHFYGDKQ